MGSVIIFILLFGCNSLGHPDADTGATPSDPGTSGIVWGSAGDDGDDGSDDNDGGSPDGGTSDGGTDSDGGTSDGGGSTDGGTSDGGTDGDGGTSDGGSTSDGGGTGEAEEIQIMIFPDYQWEGSIDPDDMETPCPVVEMYESANLTRDGWEGYGGVAFTGSGECGQPVFDTEVAAPGDEVVIGAKWNNYYAEEYYADVPGVGVRAEWIDWDGDGDEEQVVVVIYLDGTFDALEIDSEASGAWYVDSDDGAEVYLVVDGEGDYVL